MSEIEMPFGNEIDHWIKTQNKKAIGALTPAFVKALTLATEPMFRKNMGERYFANASSGGFWVWIIAVITSFFTGGLASGIFDAMGLNDLARITHSPIPGVLLTLGLFGAFIYFNQENKAVIREIRNANKTYHSMSRGVPRWADDAFIELIITAVATLILLLFAPITGALFIVSRILCFQAVSKQQAALYDRYLDAQDAKIEAERLESALLGNTPCEETYLYKPLSQDINDATRKDIAASAVGKPVKIAAQGGKTNL